MYGFVMAIHVQARPCMDPCACAGFQYFKHVVCLLHEGCTALVIQSSEPEHPSCCYHFLQDTKPIPFDLWCVN